MKSTSCYLSHLVFYLSDNTETIRIINQNNENETDNLDCLFFDLATIVDATDNFSSNNKIGEGGFGPVYRVRLHFKHMLIIRCKK